MALHSGLREFVALLNAKGVEYLIEAWPTVLAGFPEARLVLVGDGPDRDKLTRMVGTRRIGSHVRFVGRVCWEEVLTHYQHADAFVLPSVSDPKPLVIPEAMAAGLPVVGTLVDGIPEFVQDGRNGLLVTPRDPEALADAIIRLLPICAKGWINKKHEYHRNMRRCH